ncbi:hypothetical protein B0H11DRAFT_2229691 [Mycena galericulata]|nr:hypothetical protein B0H11DRAFT_2229691 [Mycena galericulata]
MSVRIHRVLKLSRPRLFSAPDDWISPLIVISRGLVSASNCVPFPYVNTALAGGLALLELIQTVGQTTDDLRYLADTETNLSQVCMEFNTHLTRLSTDIEAMSKDWSSSKFKKYLKVNSVRDEITQFTRRVTDMRANATLIAATGTRMELARVASAVAEVQSSVWEIQTAMGSTTTNRNRDLVRFEEAVTSSWILRQLGRRPLAMISVDVDGSINWPPPMYQFPVMERPAETGVTHFVVPLNGRHGPWKSLYDDRPRCGYFLNAQIGFGADVPDIALAWITQSTAFITKQDARQLYVPTQTDLRLMWEMVLCQEETATTPESLSLMEILPDHLHVYVQVPIIDGRRILEPRIYWSTDATSKDTSLIPLGTFKIRMTWELVVSASTWEQHHYEVAKSVQEECGFDPATKTAAKALGIPLLKACDATSVEPCVDEEASRRDFVTFRPLLV